MSFVFPSWSTAFSPSFYDDAKAMLEAALNKGNKPPVIQGRIEVVDLNMGTQPPTLTLLEIGDLSLDRFRGILRLGYQGDAWIEVRCRVQANPLSHHPNPLHSSALPISTPLLASQPLLVPMTLRLSLLHLRAILILVVSASKGITLVFKNDPLQNVDVSSTFDSVEVIRGYLQQEIEGQLREMFREDLPGIIHRLSQRWFTGTGTGGKVETPYRDPGGEASIYAANKGDNDNEEEGGFHHEGSPTSSGPIPHTLTSPRRRSSRTLSVGRERRLSSGLSESPTSYTVFPGIEHYDPTYGLRPEGLPTHSEYEAFGRLWGKIEQGKGRGLGSLMDNPTLLSPPPEYSSERWSDGHGGIGDGRSGRADDGDEDYYDEDVIDRDIDDGERSLDMVELDQALQSAPLSGGATGRSRSTSLNIVEWETFPAVGGGTVTRPRIYHAQSRIRAPSEAGQAMPSPSGTATATGGSVTARAASSIGAGSSTVGSLRRHDLMIPQSPLLRQATTGKSSLRRMLYSDNGAVGGGTMSSSITAAPGVSVSTPPLSSSSKQIKSDYNMMSPQQGYHQYHSQSQRQNQPSTRSVAGGGGAGGMVARRASATNSSSAAAKTSGSSWDTHDTSRSATLSTMASSQLPSSRGHAPKNRIRSQDNPSTAIGVGGSQNPTNHHHNHSIDQLSPAPPSLSMAPRSLAPGNITLPLNNSVSQLATLSHSAHTLSPYARGHEHIAVRSFPHLGKTFVGNGSGLCGGFGSSTTSTNSNPLTGLGGQHAFDSTNMGPAMGNHIKAANRKRIYRLKGGSSSSKPTASVVDSQTNLVTTPTGWDTEDGVSDEWVEGELTQQQYRYGQQQHSSSQHILPPSSKVRPNYTRRTDSRSSYGFPQVEKR